MSDIQETNVTPSRKRTEIETMVSNVFDSQLFESQRRLKDILQQTKSEFIKRGTIKSGIYFSEICRIMLDELRECVFKTIEEIEDARKENKRKDNSILWEITESKISEKIKQQIPNLKANLKSHVTNTDAVFLRVLMSLDASISQTVLSIDHTAKKKIASLKSKAIFIELKTPEDRISRGIPDVAVMMWFPDKETQNDQLQRSIEKFKIIVEAIHEASEGKATVMKFDDPSNVPQDRISNSVEEWLQKSVLVICDLEGNRPNVFYEFGYARAAGTDVIATKPSQQDIDFHLRQWQMVNYTDLSQLKTDLIVKVKRCLEKYDLSGDITQ
jgi:nucleoside 2-deoxyribosyltransferase